MNLFSFRDGVISARVNVSVGFLKWHTKKQNSTVARALGYTEIAFLSLCDLSCSGCTSGATRCCCEDAACDNAAYAYREAKIL